MGGALLSLAIFLSAILWSKFSIYPIYLTLFVLLGFSFIGMIDDCEKVMSIMDGLSAKSKLGLQIFVASIAVSLISYYLIMVNTGLFAYLWENIINLGYFYIVFGLLVIVGSSNAVTLTDGLDGLATMPVALIVSGLSIFAYLVGNKYLAAHSNLFYSPGMGELCVLCAAMVGGCLGFLWYNAHPAMVFMGDTGSLSLGATLGMIAILVKQELLLAIMGAIFVIETVSVFVQVISFKLTGKRVFKMAPIHHHFELKGWHENHVTIRFWIITLVLVLFSLATIKMRFV